MTTPTAPAYWQRQKIRKLWADTPMRKIAREVNVGRMRLRRWVDEGYLDPLPERKVPPGGFRGTVIERPAVEKLQAAPLTVEPLTQTRECERCIYELVCLARVRADLWDEGRQIGLWVGCEWPTEHHVRLAVEAGLLEAERCAKP